jgi:hypothetical protein
MLSQFRYYDSNGGHGTLALLVAFADINSAKGSSVYYVRPLLRTSQNGIFLKRGATCLSRMI